MEPIRIYDASSAQLTPAQNLYISQQQKFPPDKYEWLKSEITRLSELTDDWDGYGANSVTPGVLNEVDNLRAIMSDIFVSKISDVFANPNGTITIEWENFFKDKLSLEIGQNNYSYFIESENSAPILVDGQSIANDYKILAASLSNLFCNQIPKIIPYQGKDCSDYL